MNTPALLNIRLTAILVSALMLCSGCTGILTAESEPELPELSAANTGNFGVRPDLPTVAEIHRLNPEQANAFLNYMRQPYLANMQPNLRLYQYLNGVTSNYAYEGITYNATDSLRLNSGNCLSLAILTTALAELAGIDIGYQLMDDMPVYEFNDSFVKKGVHIRTRLYEQAFAENPGVSLFNRPGISIDYFPTNRQRFIGNIGRSEYLAMVYQNLAVEALERNDLSTAYWSALEALQYSPDHSPAINTLAVTNRRAGNLETAEFIYRYGIEHAKDKLSLMKNYAFLLTESGRTREAAAMQKRLDDMEDASPFHWFLLARESQDQGDHRGAIRFYNKALNLAPYLHEAWHGIAQANYELGRLDRTRSALQSAFTEADKVSTRNLYQAKLVALTRESGH